MRRRSTRNKKNNHDKDNNTNQNIRKIKEKEKINFYSNGNFEMQDFHSDPINNIIKNKYDVIDNTTYNKVLYSPKKPKKHHIKIVNNIMEIEENEQPFSVQSGRNQRKARTKHENYINNFIEQNDTLRSNNANKKKNNINTYKEFNYIELKNDLNEDLVQKNMSQNAKSRKRKKTNNIILNNNELICINNDKKEENKKKRMTRSYTSRNLKKELKDENKQEKIKSGKSVNNNKNKGRKDKINKEEKNKNDNLNNIKYKSRSHMSNSIKKRKEEEKITKNIEKKNNRDHLSPRNYHENNNIYTLNNMIKEEKDIIKNHSTQKMINNEKKLEKKINSKLSNDYIYSIANIDKRKFTITLNKMLKTAQPNIIIKKGIFKVSQDENLIGRKRKRNEPKEVKEKKKEIKKKSNKPKNKQKKVKEDELIDKNNLKEKSQKIPVVNIKKEADDIPNELEKLKNDLNCDKNKTVGLKGKKRTRKHKSMKKKEKIFVKVEEEINSFDSYSEPDKDFYTRDYYNHRNNYNFKASNKINLSNDQMQIENNPNNDSSKNNFQSNPQSFNNTNINNNQITNYLRINLSSDNSLKELNSETANFMEMSNNFEYSFPIDLEEKIDIKEDKTYYAKASKYLKYHPIDKYIPPISNENKMPYKKRIPVNKTNEISFTKKKENKSKNNNQMDSDNDITDITSSNNDYNSYNNDLPSILSLPRIKPFREEHTKMIKDKLNQEGIKIYQNEDKNLQKEELDLYIGSFVLYDEKNNIKVSVPCYKENINTKEFMNKKRLGIIEFQEDNDIDTDEEQLELEVQRNNNALLNFMKKVNKTKNYVEKNLVRKKKE